MAEELDKKDVETIKLDKVQVEQVTLVNYPEDRVGMLIVYLHGYENDEGFQGVKRLQKFIPMSNPTFPAEEYSVLMNEAYRHL